MSKWLNKYAILKKESRFTSSFLEYCATVLVARHAASTNSWGCCVVNKQGPHSSVICLPQFKTLDGKSVPMAEQGVMPAQCGGSANDQQSLLKHTAGAGRDAGNETCFALFVE